MIYHYLQVIFLLLIQKCLNHHSALQVLRDGAWSERDAEILVPGDIISIKLGDIIPADARLLAGDPLKIDQVSIVSIDLLVISIVSWLLVTECST